MNLCLRKVFVSLWLLYTSSIAAQVGFSLPFLNDVTPGTIINVPVQVTGFDSITSVQFVIRWNPEVVQYLISDKYGLPGLDSEDFNPMNTLDSGILRFAWSAPDLETGVTLPDDTTIFRVRLKAIGAENTGTEITLGSAPPTDLEVTRLVNDTIRVVDTDDIEIVQGFAAIGYTVSTGEPADDPFQLKVFPNPFSEHTNISFDLPEDGDLHLAVTDISGRIVLEKTSPRLSRGQHGMEIVSPKLREKGMYYLILSTKTRSCVQPLFVF